jgi:hypothetical protein
MPRKTRWEVIGAIVNMKHPPPRYLCRFLRFVEGQQPHRKDIASLRRTTQEWQFLTKSNYFRCRKPASAVRTRKDVKGTIVIVSVVEVEPQGRHPGQKLDRRLDVNHAILDVPVPIALHVAPVANGDGPILVPWHSPVRCIGFVEKHDPNRPHGERAGT